MPIRVKYKTDNEAERMLYKLNEDISFGSRKEYPNAKPRTKLASKIKEFIYVPVAHYNELPGTYGAKQYKYLLWASDKHACWNSNMIFTIAKQEILRARYIRIINAAQWNMLH